MMKFKIQLILSLSVLGLLISFATFAQTQSQKFGTNPTNIAPSAVLEIESANKGVLFPRVTLSSTSDVTTIASPATGLTVFNTASAGTSPNNVTPGYYYWNGSKWVKMAIETPFAKTVYVNATSPTTATIFDENNPPATNDDALKDTDVNLYIGNDGSTWTYNTSTSEYNTFTVPASTPFNLANTNTDAGSEKINAIWRSGRVGIGTNNPLTQLQVQHPTAATNTVNADAQVLRLSRPATGGVKEDNFAQFNLGSYENTGTSSFQARTRLDLALKDGVGTASTNVMTWNANGNVGIGTTAPTQRLDVNGSGLFRNGNASNTFTNNQVLFGWNGTNQFMHSIKTRHQGTGAAGNAIDFFTWTNADGASVIGTRHVLTIDASGVGIRSTAPQALLDVAPTEGSSSVSISTVGSAATDQASLFFGTRFNNRNSPVGTSTNLGWQIGARGNAFSGSPNTFHASYWNGSALENHLTILSNGNMGIKGITNPQQALDINGTALFRINNNSAPQILLGFSNAHQVRSRHSGSLSASNAIDFNVWRATDLVATGAAVQVMTLQGDGKVGIGTNAPVSQLDVNTPLAATATINTDANMLKLTRPTTQGSKIGNVAQFDLGSYAVLGTDALTRLDLGLNNLQSLTTSPVMTWQGNGNVGIGTTAPANKLEITQGTAGNSGLRFTNLNSASAAATSSNKVLALNSTGDVILANIPNTQNIVSFSTATPTTAGVVFDPNIPTDQSVIYQSETDNSLWTYNGTSYVTYTPPASTAWNLAGTTNDAGNNKTAAIWRNGNVAIGTQNPTATFEVATTSGLTSILRRGSALLQTPANLILQKTANANPAVNTAIPDGDHIGRILFSAANGTNYLTNGTSIIGYAAGLQSPTNNGGGISFRTVPQGSISIAVERMRIEHNGNVGIGTITPSTTLEVANINTIAFQSTINASSNPAALGTSGFNDANPNVTKASSGIQFLGWDGKKEGGIFRQTGSNDKSHLMFTVNAANDVAMTINESRNVGIGTTAPSSKLEINSGTAGTSGLEFTQLTAASANTSTAISSPIGVDANGVVVPLGSSRRAEPLATNATFDITVNTFGGYKVTVAGSDASFRTFADEYIVTYANSFVRLSVAQTGGVHSAGGAQTMQTAYNVATATLTPTHGLYSITFNANGTSNVITTRALASLALITTKTQSLW